MSNIVFLNGDFLPADEAKVSIFDRGYLFGDGIYEVVPVINGKVIDKAPFFERFDASLSKIALQAPFCKAEIITILDTLIAKNDLKEVNYKSLFEFLDSVLSVMFWAFILYTLW